MASPSSRTALHWILTASVTAITVTGALYGAGLKTRQEFTQEKAAVLVITPAERIEQLEFTKKKFLREKAELQSKLDRLSAKADATASDVQA